MSKTLEIFRSTKALKRCLTLIGGLCSIKPTNRDFGIPNSTGDMFSGWCTTMPYRDQGQQWERVTSFRLNFSLRTKENKSASPNLVSWLKWERPLSIFISCQITWLFQILGPTHGQRLLSAKQCPKAGLKLARLATFYSSSSLPGSQFSKCSVLSTASRALLGFFLLEVLDSSDGYVVLNTISIVLVAKASCCRRKLYSCPNCSYIWLIIWLTWYRFSSQVEW